MRKWVLPISILTLSACDLAPEFKLPEISLPAAFKGEAVDAAATVEPAADGKWKRVDDKAQIEEFAWWRMFGDAKLDALMEAAMKDNPSLEVALERVNAARATAQNRDADLYPAIEVGVGPERSRGSEASQRANMGSGSAPEVKPHTFYRAGGTITYELDLFGRERNRSVAAWFDAESEAENYRAARLTLQTELAQTYFRLAALKAEESLLNATVETRKTSLSLIEKKHEVGAVDALVVAAAQTELATISAQAAAITNTRVQAENGLAVLAGKSPSDAVLEVPMLTGVPPTVPAGLPSSLLERRPDIKRAVDAMKAANARIGVARTGYFPEISLSAMGGFVSGDLKDLFNWSSRTWAIGPMAGTILTQPIFEGGRIAAARAQTDADFNASVAQYRAAVLQAFREVEDQLSATSAAVERRAYAQTGLDAATRAEEIAQKRFDAGYSSHLELLDANRSKLAAERAQVQIAGEQYVALVQLIKALGGSWDTPAAPEATGALTTP